MALVVCTGPAWDEGELDTPDADALVSEILPAHLAYWLGKDGHNTIGQFITGHKILVGL